MSGQSFVINDIITAVVIIAVVIFVLGTFLYQNVYISVLICSSPIVEEAVLYFNYEVGKDISTELQKHIIESIENITVSTGDTCTNFTVHAVGAGSVTLILASSSPQFTR